MLKQGRHIFLFPLGCSASSERSFVVGPGWGCASSLDNTDTHCLISAPHPALPHFPFSTFIVLGWNFPNKAFTHYLDVFFSVCLCFFLRDKMQCSAKYHRDHDWDFWIDFFEKSTLNQDLKVTWLYHLIGKFPPGVIMSRTLPDTGIYWLLQHFYCH